MGSAVGLPAQNKVCPHDSLSDDELVWLSQRGDNHAFAQLMKRHRSAAMKLALSIVREYQDAEDEVQNAFWRAYEHIQQFQHGARFKTWLTRIVVNQCLMRLRQQKRARFYYIDDTRLGEEVVTLDLEDRSPGPEGQLCRREIGEVLRREIHHIPPLLRHVFLMREVEQKTMPEVAAALGISVAAAKSRLLRARAELRCRLRRYCGRIGAAALFAS